MSSMLKFTSKFWKYKYQAVFLPKLTGKLCFLNQRYNLPESTGKFTHKLQSVTIYQSTLAGNAIIKFRNSRFTGKFWFWVQSSNLPVNFENSNFWLFVWFSLVNFVVEFRITIYQSKLAKPIFTGKFCCWIQKHNLPVRVGKK